MQEELIIGLTKARVTDEGISSFSEVIGNIPTPWKKGDVITFPDTIEGNAFKTLIGNKRLEYIVVDVRCADGSERQDKFFPSLFRKRARKCEWEIVEGVNVATPTDDFVVAGGRIVEPLYTKKSRVNDIVLAVIGKSIKISNVWEVKSIEFGSSNPKLVNVYDFEPEGWSIYNEHEWVDLGLSVKWATCNVGASSPWECGDTFRWGFSGWSFGDLQFDGYLDEKGNLTSEVDKATATWGGNWRMPTESEMEELVENCKWEWTMIHCNKCCKVTGPNGNSILLPVEELIDIYWSSTPCQERDSDEANGLWINCDLEDSSPSCVIYISRLEVALIRPVLD